MKPNLSRAVKFEKQESYSAKIRPKTAMPTRNLKTTSYQQHVRLKRIDSTEKSSKSGVFNINAASSVSYINVVDGTETADNKNSASNLKKSSKSKSSTSIKSIGPISRSQSPENQLKKQLTKSPKMELSKVGRISRLTGSSRM